MYVNHFPTNILLLFQDPIQYPTFHLVAFLLKSLHVCNIFSIFLFHVPNTLEKHQSVILLNIPKFVVFWCFLMAEMTLCILAEFHRNNVLLSVHHIRFMMSKFILLVIFTLIIWFKCTLPVFTTIVSIFHFALKYVCWGRCFESMQVGSLLTFAL